MKFSIKQLIFITTIVAVLMGAGIWLEMFESNWRVVATLSVCFLIYLSIVAVFYGPRYLRDWKEFRANVKSQRLVRKELESEVEEFRAASESDSEEAE